VAARDWISKYGALLDGLGPSCPECETGILAVRFVGDPATRIGFARMFCVACRSVFHLSRVQVPPTQDLIPFDAPDALRDLDGYRWIE
jgi:hypothetical protein